ncbi:MAG: tyrosine-type recombinase/integrase, partial [Gemmataceae bacterium]
MPRKPQISYYESRQAFFTKLNRQHHRLAVGPNDAPHGPTYLKALSAFRDLMERGNLEKDGDANSVRAVIVAYLDAKSGEVRSSTARMKRDKLTPFVESYGDLQITELKAHHAETLIAKMRKRRTVRHNIKGKDAIFTHQWNNSSVRLFLSQLKAAFTWATNNEYITRNPFRSIKPPSVHYKSRERIVNKEEHDKVVASIKTPRSQPIKRLIIALENCGCRPSELTHARVQDFDVEMGAIVYHADEHRNADEHAHKTSGKGKERIVYFTGDALNMVIELIRDKKSNDYIFVNGKGRPYTSASIDNAFAVIRRRLNLPHYVPYSYRHTLATNWLKQGKSIDDLAAI